MSPTAGPRLEPITTASALAERLRSEINSGRWKPGEVLRQEELAAEFAVSRIPIREALAQLHTEGLVLVEHYRGAHVRGLQPAQIEEIFDLRLLIEGDALRRAVPAHDAQSVQSLRRLQARLDTEDDRLAWIATDRAFHEALYAPAGRPRTVDLVRQLRAPVERFSVQRLSPRARRREWAEEHQALIASVQAGDAARALEALGKHLNQTRAIVLAAARSITED